MLVEYLDNAANEIDALRLKARQIKEEYEEVLDRDLRVEITSLNKKMRIKKRNIWETIYENIDEFRYMKKDFPHLFSVYMEDDAIGKILRKKEWLAEFYEMKKEDAERSLKKIRGEIAGLKKLKKSIRALKEPFSESQIGNVWKLLEKRITKDTDHYQLEQTIDDEIKHLRKIGWSILINEQFILKYVNLFLDDLKDAVKKEEIAQKHFNDSIGQGTYHEYQAKQNLNKAIKSRKLAELKCRHLLMANPKFLAKFKKQNLTWRDKEVAAHIKKFLDGINQPQINEKEWIEEMKKKINI